MKINVAHYCVILPSSSLHIYQLKEVSGTTVAKYSNECL